MAIKLYKSQVNVSRQQSSVPTAKLEGNFGQAVFEGQQQLLNTTMEIKQRHRSMQEDKDVIEHTTKYNEDLNQIIVDHNKLNNYDEGMLSYQTATNELLTNTTANIKNNNVKRRVEEHALKYNSAYKIDIGKNIRTNNTKIFKDSLELKKNEAFNTILTSNPALQTQLRDELFYGQDSLYNQELKAGTLEAGVTEETYTQALENQFELAEAKYFIDTNLNKFLQKDKSGNYNNLDFAQLSSLRSTAQGKLSSIQKENIASLTTNKTNLKEKINDVIDVTKEGYFPDIENVQNLITDTTNLNQILLANGKDGLENELNELKNSIEVYEFVSPLKQEPMSQLVASFNNIENKLLTTQGTDKFNKVDISKKNALEKYINYRKANEEKHLLNVGVNSGYKIEPLNFTNIENLSELDKRYVDALTVQNQFAKESPQFFLKNEKIEIANVLNTGSEEEIKNLIINISAMSKDFGPTAFQQLNDIDGASGIAQIGILYNVTGENSQLNAAIKAFALRDDTNTKSILSQYNTTDFQLSNIKSDAFQTLQISPLFDDRTPYKMMNEAADLIFQGLILSNPKYAKKFQTDLMAPDVSDEMAMAVNIAAGFNNGYGGFENYNGYKITVPGIMQGQAFHKNAEIGDGKNTLEDLLDNNMNDDLLATAVSSTPYFNGEFMDPPRSAKAEDLFDQDKVHLIPYGFGTYTFVFGDNPSTSDLEVRDKDGQLVIFDIKKIYNQINK